MSGYLKQKLFQAMHDLVGAGDIDKRLTHAGNYLVHLHIAIELVGGKLFDLIAKFQEPCITI